MYRFRFIRIILGCLFAKPKQINDVFELHFRMIPFLDTDFSRLFTQTYVSLMGLARWHYVFGSILGKVALKNKWAPVTTSDTITYKKSIKAFAKVTLRTRLIAWNDHRFYLEHVFWNKGVPTERCLVEGLIRAPQGILKPGDVFKAAGLTESPPPIPEDLKIWIQFLQKKV